MSKRGDNQHDQCEKSATMEGGIGNEYNTLQRDTPTLLATPSNTGAVAGGVVGGLLMIGGVGVAVWWFVLKPKLTATKMKKPLTEREAYEKGTRSTAPNLQAAAKEFIDQHHPTKSLLQVFLDGYKLGDPGIPTIVEAYTPSRLVNIHSIHHLN